MNRKPAADSEYDTPVSHTRSNNAMAYATMLVFLFVTGVLVWMQYGM